MSSEKMINWLFQTDAIRVCPENKPFWYTSGTIGPYYVNTHYLYGTEQKATELLAYIDDIKNDKIMCPELLTSQIMQNYENSQIYKNLIEYMIKFIKDNVNIDQVDYISGGERRDWFFSLLAAKFLDKPHIMIFKDMSAVITYNGVTREFDSINGGNVLHIADLITEASSYERAWIPAIRNFGGKLHWSVVVVDRKQGGEELLNNYGVQSKAMVSIDKELFIKACKMGKINTSQLSMILEYIDNPKQAMQRFLQQNPNFISEAFKSDDKTRERVKLCIDKGIYL